MNQDDRQLTIGIDASRAVLTQRTGTEHYSASLLHALAELPEAAAQPIALYVNLRNPQSAIRNLQFDLPPAWRIRAIPFPRLWTHVRLSWEMLTRPPRTLFVPSHVVPLWHPRRTVVTIHDLGYLEYPQAHTRASWLYLHLSTWFSAHAARHVIAISEATKRDLIKHYKIKPGKIEVIYHGRDPIFTPVTDTAKIEQTLKKYGINQPYCVHIGTLQPRKNLGVLVQAWDILRARMESPPQLLLAGKRGWLYDSLLQSVKERNLGDLVKFADYVERDDLPTLYSAALALTFPSLYEGFGLPPLEAMSCGTPVLASTASSVPEVVGDAGILLDPKDAGAWADAVQRVVQDDSLREDLSRRGLVRANQFTWERCARETLSVLLSPNDVG
jgi:glycosyltransferase involved in cell wall biosynthesis